MFLFVFFQSSLAQGFFLWDLGRGAPEYVVD